MLFRLLTLLLCCSSMAFGQDYFYKKYTPFNDFMIKIHSQTDQFQELSSIIHRYETLHSAYMELDEKDILNEENLKRLRKDLKVFKESKEIEFMKMHNMVAGLQIDMDTAQNKKAEAENFYNHIYFIIT